MRHVPIRAMLLMVLLLTNAARAADEPKTADQAILTVAKALSENKPVAVWEALPASYQKDVNELLRTAVSKVDPELYSQAIGTTTKIVKLLKDQKQFIFGHPAMAQMPNKAEIEKQWDPMINMLNTLLTSELASHEKMKTIDVGAFLERTGSKVMSQAAKAAQLAGAQSGALEEYERLKNIKATLVNQSGDKATVKIEAPGKEPKEVEFTRVEGKWLPSELTDQWKENVAEAKAKLNSVTDQQVRETKDMAAPMLAATDAVIGMIAKAKTQEEFNSAINGLLQLIGGGAGDEEAVPCN